MATIKIKRTTGVEECIQNIKMSYGYIKKFDKPLSMMSTKLEELVNLNFESEGVVFGKKWKNLAPSTIKHKERLKELGKSNFTYEILLRTGQMKEGFRYVIRKKRGGSLLEVSNTAPYFSKHQSNDPSARTTTTQGMTTETGFRRGRPKKVVLPRRIMLNINEKVIKDMYNIAEKWIGDVPNVRKTKKLSDGWEQLI